MSEIAGSLVGGITLNIKELDGSPSGYPYQLKVSNGTLTDNNDGTFTLNTGGGGSGTFTKEVPSGTIDGNNVTFTLAHTPISGTENIFLNGQLLTGSGNDYTISGSTITFTVPPLVGSDSTTIIIAFYFY